MRGYIKELVEVLPKDLEGYRNSDFTVKRTVERDLQLISDSEIDVLALLSKVESLGISSTEENLIKRFSKLLGNPMVNDITELRRIRNLIVHAYSSQSYDEVLFKQGGSTEKFQSFIKHIDSVLSEMAEQKRQRT